METTNTQVTTPAAGGSVLSRHRARCPRLAWRTARPCHRGGCRCSGGCSCAGSALARGRGSRAAALRPALRRDDVHVYEGQPRSTDQRPASFHARRSAEHHRYPKLDAIQRARPLHTSVTHNHGEKDMTRKLTALFAATAILAGLGTATAVFAEENTPQSAPTGHGTGTMGGQEGIMGMMGQIEPRPGEANDPDGRQLQPPDGEHDHHANRAGQSHHPRLTIIHSRANVAGRSCRSSGEVIRIERAMLRTSARRRARSARQVPNKRRSISHVAQATRAWPWASISPRC